jgi:tetratricopeptide (TPR) repeat protein
VFIGEARDAEEAEHGRRVVGILSRDVWKHCPHPAHGYAPAPLEPIAPNAPCHCGSGLKYAQCCQPIEANMPGIAINWLTHFIEHLPRTRWKDLPGSRIPPEMVIDLAVTWQRAERYKDIASLLAPWFVDDAHLRQPYGHLQDLLLEAWEQLGKRKLRSDLIDRAIAHGDTISRSSALQHKATALADAGDFENAWELFREAQRATPDDPSLAHLEVLLLVNSDREDEARERARFWIARIARRKEPHLQGLLELLRGVVAEGGDALDDFAEKADGNP